MYIFEVSYSTLVTSVKQKLKYGPIRSQEITDIRLLHELYVISNFCVVLFKDPLYIEKYVKSNFLNNSGLVVFLLVICSEQLRISDYWSCFDDLVVFYGFRRISYISSDKWKYLIVILINFLAKKIIISTPRAACLLLYFKQLGGESVHPPPPWYEVEISQWCVLITQKLNLMASPFNNFTYQGNSLVKVSISYSDCNLTNRKVINFNHNY